MWGSRSARPSAARAARGPSRASTPCEHGGFSAYLSGQYSQQDLFVNQAAWNRSTGRQLNGKLQYAFDGGKITAFADISRTNQADDPYLSKDMLSRLGYDWGGYAPDWFDYVNRSYCSVTGPRGADQVRRLEAAGKARRRHVHQRPDPAQRRSVLPRRGLCPHQVPDRARESVSPRGQGAPATTGSPAGPRRARRPPPMTCRSRSATRATPSTVPACSET